jgi:putative phosphoesterase
MKIGVIADLHIDRGNKYSPEDFEYCLIKTAQNKDIELLLIAGDISNNYQMTADYINKIKQLLNIPVLFIPGNHDFWTNDTDRSSLEILDFYLNMDECLIDRPYCINDEWAIVGNTAWYDYSYGDSKFSEERLAQRKYYGATWQDKEKIDWPLNDQSMSELALKQTEKDLAKVKDKKIILMTHIVTHSQFVVPTPHRIFDYFNAFIGTSKFNKLYNTYPIKYSIMGHVHFRKSVEEAGITYICPCLGYERQWRTKDLQTELDNTLVTITV